MSNHLTAIGSQTPTYDADGNLTSDGTGTGTTTYQYDAEGRVVDASTPSAGTWNSAVYDALGHWVAESMPDAGTTRTFLFPRDLEGHWQGLFDIRPSTGWYGWNVGSVAQAGIVLQWCCGYTYLQHFNALGSTLMTTDQTGAVQRQQINGPWGQGWEYYGSWYTVRYAGMDFPKLQGNDVASFRDYNPTMGRWLMPDPAGRAAANPANPQSWNMYAYVGDNPTSVTDPSGLDWVTVGNCSYDQATATVEVWDKHTGYTASSSSTFIAATAGQCSGIADGDNVAPPVVPDTTMQYRISNQMLVAAEQNLTPKLVLEGRVFVSTLVQNFLDEFKKGGCVALFNKTAFGEPLHQASDVIKEGPEVLQNAGEGVVGGGLIFTSLGAWSEGATVLISSGLKLQSVAETAAVAGPHLAVGLGDAFMFYGLGKEIKAMMNGNCH